MAKQNKISKSFRLDRSTVALMETYAKENKITNTETVELAIKRLCRESATPATQQDLQTLGEMMKAHQTAILKAIQEQPIQIAGQIEDEKKKRGGFMRWLIG